MLRNLSPLSTNIQEVYVTSAPLSLSMEFRNLTTEERAMYIKKQRKRISEELTLSKWFSIQNGNVAFLQIIEMMRIMIYMIPTYVSDPTKQSVFDPYGIDVRILDILFRLLDSTKVDHVMLPDWDVQCCQIEKNGLDEEILLHRMKSNWHRIYQDHIREAIYELEKEMEAETKMTESQKLAVVHKLSDMSYFIFDFVVEKALNSFREDIANIDTWVNTFHFLCLMDCLPIRCNFFLFDVTTGLPYEGMRYFCLDKMKNNGYPFAFLLYFPDVHFESLGETIERNGKRYINRLFQNNHPYVQQCIDFFENSPSVSLKNESEEKQKRAHNKHPAVNDGVGSL